MICAASLSYFTYGFDITGLNSYMISLFLEKFFLFFLPFYCFAKIP